MSREDFKPFIPADKIIPEITFKAILVGVFLAITLGAANAYLGLYAGMTVSAIIPGAVLALALMKPFKPTILEVNITTMGASAGGFAQIIKLAQKIRNLHKNSKVTGEMIF